MKAGIFTTTLKKIVDLGIQQTRHFKLTFEAGTPFEFDAGQFVNILIPETAEHKAIKRPYSIASPPLWKGFFDLCWKRVRGGIATNYFWTLKEGDKLQIQGPLGRFTIRQPLPQTIVFVSTGTGIAPFRSMIHTLLESSSPLPSPPEGARETTKFPPKEKMGTLELPLSPLGREQGEGLEIWNIFGNRYEEDILYKDEFEDLAKKHPNFRNVFTVSRPKTWKGETQYVQFMLKKYISNPACKHLYICGLTNMIFEVQKTALEMGFSKDQIFFEKYD